MRVVVADTSPRYCQVSSARLPGNGLSLESVLLMAGGDQASADARVTSFQIRNRLLRSFR